MRQLQDITGEIVNAAVLLHMRIGPGLIESVYESLLATELRRRGLNVQRQLELDFEFDGTVFERGVRLDLLVEGEVVVELKSVERIARVHSQQVLTYLRLLDLPVGLLLNFGMATMKEGIHRIANGYRAVLPVTARARGVGEATEAAHTGTRSSTEAQANG